MCALKTVTMDQTFDFSRYFTHNILVYKIFGFWRPDDDMPFKKIYNCYTAFCTVVWILFLLSQATYIIKNSHSVQEVTATLYITGTFTIDLVKMIFIYKNMNHIKLLIKELNQPLFQVKCQKHHSIAVNAKRVTNIIFYLCLYMGLQTDVFWSVIPFLGEERTTVSKGWFPYDWKKPLNFALTYIFQNSVSIWNTLICLNLDTFTATLLIQVGVQCDILCATLNSLDDFYTKNGVLYEMPNEDKLALRQDKERFSEAMIMNLVVCIHHHRDIMRIAKDIERFHRTSVFVLFIGGSLIMCCCLFQLTVVRIGSLESFTFLLFLLCMLTEQLLYCWFGNEVICKSSLILESSYNTPWIDCNVKFQKVLLQFMTQTNRPIKVVAGGLFTMSVSVFISVLRTSYSYFTLLRTLE